MVTDSIKDWSLDKHGYYDLPDYFISDFRQIHAAKGTKYENWQKALQMHINRNSPSGIYHSPKIWEAALEKCKDKMKREEVKIPVPKMKTTPKRSKPKLAREEIRKMYEILGNV